MDGGRLPAVGGVVVRHAVETVTVAHVPDDPVVFANVDVEIPDEDYGSSSSLRFWLFWLSSLLASMVVHGQFEELCNGVSVEFRREVEGDYGDLAVVVVAVVVAVVAVSVVVADGGEAGVFAAPVGVTPPVSDDRVPVAAEERRRASSYVSVDVDVAGAATRGHGARTNHRCESFDFFFFAFGVVVIIPRLGEREREQDFIITIRRVREWVMPRRASPPLCLARPLCCLTHHWLLGGVSVRLCRASAASSRWIAWSCIA